jgi:hypothetical protein
VANRNVVADIDISGEAGLKLAGSRNNSAILDITSGADSNLTLVASDDSAVPDLVVSFAKLLNDQNR